ncbi:death-associated protein 1 [Oratosquilla oratoria]|uniref:death-associated protein 1 n=1 Tax=Oratosquilla oratoria TaxID=337810 RepID=UPI003F75944B
MSPLVDRLDSSAKGTSDVDLISKVQLKSEGMSSVEEMEVKAGHPPALKVGGMRVANRKRSTDEKETPPPPKPVQKKEEEGEEGEEEEEVTAKSPPKNQVIVSGVVGKVERDFPTAAVKHTHEKPVPTHDNRSTNPSKPVVIQQPRKM